jgi:hypothetical protein
VACNVHQRSNQSENQHRRHGEEYGGRGRLSIIDQLGVCPVDFEDMLRMLHRDQTAFCI